MTHNHLVESFAALSYINYYYNINSNARLTRQLHICNLYIHTHKNGWMKTKWEMKTKFLHTFRMRKTNTFILTYILTNFCIWKKRKTNTLDTVRTFYRLSLFYSYNKQKQAQKNTNFRQYKSIYLLFLLRLYYYLQFAWQRTAKCLGKQKEKSMNMISTYLSEKVFFSLNIRR